MSLLNIAKILSWIAMLYMIVTSNDYFMGAVVFYFTVLAVVTAIGTVVIIGSVLALDSPRTAPMVRLDTLRTVNQLTQESYATVIVPACISFGLLWMIGLPLLAWSQVGVIIMCVVSKYFANRV